LDSYFATFSYLFRGLIALAGDDSVVDFLLCSSLFLYKLGFIPSFSSVFKNVRENDSSSNRFVVSDVDDSSAGMVVCGLLVAKCK
jgi:hypothetical protein